MKVLLINPPVQDSYINPVLKNLFYNSPPLGLCYLAAVLKKDGVEAKIIDAAVEKLTIEQVIKRAKSIEPDIIGVSSTTYSFPSAVLLAAELKKIIGDKKIMIGGPHITSNPEDILKYKCFDFGVIGEGEVTVSELARAIKNGDNIDGIAGLVFNQKGRLYFSPKRPFIDDLDSLPFPDRDLVPLELYKPQPNDWKILPKMSMISSRGCPYGCIFCDKGVFGQNYRSFSARYIVSEMKLLIEKYKAKDIAFVDSTFTVSAERVRDIISEMKRQNINVNWTCTVRANIMTGELLKEMKDAGCWRVRIGVESANDEVLKFIKKGITKEQVLRVTKLAAALGLQPKGFFSIGHLVDTKESINETIKFALATPFKDITVQINTPLKNTPQYKIYKDHGGFVEEPKVDYSFWQPSFVPNGMTAKELSALHKKFYRVFYCRFIIIWRHLREIKSIQDLRKYIMSIDLFLYLFLGTSFSLLKLKLKKINDTQNRTN